MSVIINWGRTEAEFNLTARATIEHLVTAMEDFAYGYDIRDQMEDTLKDALETQDISYEIEEDDLI